MDSAFLLSNTDEQGASGIQDLDWTGSGKFVEFVLDPGCKLVHNLWIRTVIGLR